MYLYIPYFKSQIENSSATTLFSNAMFLDNAEQVGNNDMYKIYKVKSKGYDINNLAYRTNYGFSFWIYVNPQKKQPAKIPNTNETPIFDFGQKPRFSYIPWNTDTTNDKNNNLVNDKFVIHFTNKNDAQPMYISLGKQKWHYIFFNYFNEHVELYLDGKLERTYIFNDKLPTYSTDDCVNLGYDDGLYGAICNVKYYEKNMIPENISRIYNLLMFSNPPTD